ncbi:MAG: hypothetical protein FWG57_01145 [Endomicrobia bacterium]|nr:hypothetical protein [Endomicrobiia bacterium]
MSSFPKKGQKLFISGGHPREYAYISHFGGIDSHFYKYIIGYKETADIIIQHAFEKGNNYIVDLDTSVFPVCFLYRHYLELWLKVIYLANSKDTKEEKIETLKDCQHNLRKIWEKAKALIITDFPNDDKTELDAVEDYIFQFASEDEKSFAFRYPITRDLELINKKEEKEKYINLRNLKERMDELEFFFSGASAGMSVNRDFERDFEEAMENEMESYY